MTRHVRWPARVERDFLGERTIPADVYWGVHTARALENFAISGVPISVHPPLVRALGAVKQAAARTNRDLGELERDTARLIDRACDDVRSGLLDDQFVVDVIQGGAGTSTNMNANEVIANRALELGGYLPGRYDVVHPNDHVNRGQSTNDVYPTAMKVALLTSLEDLSRALGRLVVALQDKGEEFAHVPKVGRTQLQDAVPMTVGQEFAAWSVTLDEEQARLADARQLLSWINLGATAIGTGITSAPGYAGAVAEHLRRITELPLVTAPNLVEATSDTGSFVQLSGTLKRTAVKLSKICHDLRLLSSGPQCGFEELRLPARQAGSSIMPGKVNPVIPEAVNQVAFAIAGNDVTVTFAAEAGQLQLNAFEPIMCHGLLQSVGWLARSMVTLTDHCVTGIQVNEEQLRTAAARSVGVVTALVPVLGYSRASEIARAVLAGDGDVRALVLASGALDAARLDELLRLERLTSVE